MERRPLKPRTVGKHQIAMAAALALAGAPKDSPVQMPLFGRLKRRLARAMGRAKLSFSRNGTDSIRRRILEGRMSLPEALQAAPGATRGTQRKWARAEYRRRTGTDCSLRIAQQLVPVVL